MVFNRDEPGWLPAAAAQDVAELAARKNLAMKEKNVLYAKGATERNLVNVNAITLHYGLCSERALSTTSVAGRLKTGSFE